MVTIRFCNSFGYGRGNLNYEYHLENQKIYFDYHIRSNLSEATKVITRFKQDLLPYVKLIELNEDPTFNKFNIYSWSK